MTTARNDITPRNMTTASNNKTPRNMTTASNNKTPRNMTTTLNTTLIRLPLVILAVIIPPHDTGRDCNNMILAPIRLTNGQ